MKLKNLLATLVIAMVVFTVSCKEDDVVTPGRLTDIPLQTVVQAPIDLGSAGNYVILAGSGFSNVPASSITGNIGLSPAAGSFLRAFRRHSQQGEHLQHLLR